MAHETVTAALPPMPINPEQRRLVRRYNLIQELVYTEESYVRDLGVIVDVFIAKLKSERFVGYISADEYNALFSNIEQVHELAREFAKELRRTIPDHVMTYNFSNSSGSSIKMHSSGSSSPTENFSKSDDDGVLGNVETGIGKVMLEYLPKMEKVYQTYCDQNRLQMQTFYQLKDSAPPIVDAWLKECLEQTREMTKAWTLDSLLIKPVQRLLKYPLLFDSILKATSSDNCDFESLELAAKEIHKVTDRINSTHEQSIESTSINDDLSSTTIVPSSSPSSSVADLSKDGAIKKPKLKQDKALEDLIFEFHLKGKHVKSVVKAIRTNCTLIQQHFDKNGRLAKSWLSWAMALTPEESQSEQGTHKVAQAERYTNYALFSAPFTSDSTAKMSSKSLSDKIDKDILQVLESVKDIYTSTDTLIQDRRKYFLLYREYIYSKSRNSYGEDLNNNTPQAPAGVSESTKHQADLYVKYSNSLKDGLPEIFRLTEEMIEICTERYIIIQREWFRLAADSLANVFNIQVNDIKDSENDPIVETFKRDSTETSIEKLTITKHRESSIELLSTGSEEEREKPSVSSSSSLELKKKKDVGISSHKSQPLLHLYKQQNQQHDEYEKKKKLGRRNSLLSLSNWQLSIKSKSSSKMIALDEA